MLGSKKSWKRRSRGIIALSVATVLSVTACGSSGDATPELNSEPSTEALVSIIRSVSMDYEPHASPETLSDEAALSIVGTVTSVDDGRVFGVGPTRDTEPRFLNFTLTVRVDQVLAGNESLIDDGLVYIELSRSKENTVGEFRKAMPDGQRFVAFLSDYSDGLGSFPLIEKASSIPDGEPILAPYADGLLAEDANTGELMGVYATLSELAPNWSEGSSSVGAFIARHFPRAQA